MKDGRIVYETYRNNTDESDALHRLLDDEVDHLGSRGHCRSQEQRIESIDDPIDRRICRSWARAAMTA